MEALITFIVNPVLPGKILVQICQDCYFFVLGSYESLECLEACIRNG